MAEFIPWGEALVEKYHLLIVQKGQRLFRLYVSVDGRWFGHCDTSEHPSLQDAIDSIIANFDPRLFEVFPATPFSKEEILAKAPHAFDSQHRG